MGKFTLKFVFIFMTLAYRGMAGPIEVERSFDDDLETSKTFGLGYYEPNVYAAPLVANNVPLDTTSVVTAPLAATTTLTSNSASYARSGYGYGSEYKHGSGYGFGNHWSYDNNGVVNEFYRHHPVYVAWG